MDVLFNKSTSKLFLWLAIYSPGGVKLYFASFSPKEHCLSLMPFSNILYHRIFTFGDDQTASFCLLGDRSLEKYNSWQNGTEGGVPGVDSTSHFLLKREDRQENEKIQLCPSLSYAVWIKNFCPAPPRLKLCERYFLL